MHQRLELRISPGTAKRQEAGGRKYGRKQHWSHECTAGFSVPNKRQQSSGCCLVVADMSSLKWATLGAASSGGQCGHKTQLKELKKMSSCWASCGTGPMAKCGISKTARMQLWNCHEFESSVGKSWLGYSPQTMGPSLTHRHTHMIWEISFFLPGSPHPTCPTRHTACTSLFGSWSFPCMFSERHLWDQRTSQALRKKK